MTPVPSAWPREFNLCRYFLDQNLDAGRADKVALRCGDRQQTYGELHARVRRLAAAFRSRGLRPEERVLIVLPDGFAFAETWFACLRAGGVFAMVNPLLKRSEFEYYLRYTKARIVVTAADVLPEIEAAAREAPLCESLFVVSSDGASVAEREAPCVDYEAAIAEQSGDDSLSLIESTGPDDLAGWLFTSGSTGEPKACVHVQSDFAFSTETYALDVVGYHEDDVCLSVPKLFFGYATGTNLMFPFRVGATSILFPGRSTADELFDQIERCSPTLLTGVPTLFGSMLRSPRIDSADFSSLRACLSAGEALPAQIYKAWKARTGVEILDGIGSAEMFHIYISNRPGDVKVGSLGKVVPGYQVEIIGSEGESLKAGQLGRLRVHGASTALCYWADKQKSNETFLGDCCTTADVFRVDEDGYYFYEGRDDDLLKVSGIWVSPLEIEDVLLRHEAVAEVCVVGRKDPDGLIKPYAYVVTGPDQQTGDDLAAELKAHVKHHLAPYKYPRWFEWRSELPKNDRGKVARKQLRDEASATAAEGVS
ncbi:MAG: benzoate-CoA ligase family protein [Planctomycetota bacterium]|jgi:benzoate-CoA ligase family protein